MTPVGGGGLWTRRLTGIEAPAPMTPVGAVPPHPRAAKGRPYEGHRSTGGSGTRPYGRAGSGGPVGAPAPAKGARGMAPHGLGCAGGWHPPLREGTEAVAYAGSGATAEELAVFKCSSEDAAGALVSSLETRNQTRIEQYSSYNPVEVPKLESALIMSSGVYVVLCVATDVSGVRQAAESALG